MAVIKITEMPSSINLGHKKENDTGIIQIDVSEWDALYPGCVYHITVQRPNETGNWPATGVTHADGVLTWLVPNTVTSIDGQGSLVIHCTIGGKEKNTGSCWYFVGAGHDAMGEAPEPVADWIADAAAKLGEVDHFIGETIAATESANTATGLANNATLAANNAAELANANAGLANNATLAANNAAELANAKAGLANDATLAANNAAELANANAGLANNATLAANNAAELANANAGLANNATLAANNAAELANAKAGLANDAAALASTKAGEANSAATSANNAADRADTIAGTMEGIAPLWADAEISVTPLEPYETPTAAITQDENGTHFDLGIPDGRTYFATFEINYETGMLEMTTPDGYDGPVFTYNEDTGMLEVTI